MVASPKKGAKPRRVGYLKMRVIDDLSKDAINEAVRELASDTTEVATDGSRSYVDLKEFILRHDAQVIPIVRQGEIGLRNRVHGS